MIVIPFRKLSRWRRRPPGRGRPLSGLQRLLVVVTLFAALVALLAEERGLWWFDGSGDVQVFDGLGISFGSGSVRVVDGDTFDRNGERVRVWGIDAPEASARYGPAATAALRRLVRGDIRCQRPPTMEDRDRYGRLVRRCFTEDGKDISAELVRQGWAVDWPRYSNGIYADEQREARWARRGIWRAVD